MILQWECTSAIGLNRLNPDEHTTLEYFLASATGSRDVNLEAVDGFFCALVVGPQDTNSFNVAALMSGFAADALPDAESPVPLLLRHFEIIVATVARGERYEPYLSGGVPSAPGERWASGFMQATMLRELQWRPVFEADGERRALESILLLSHGRAPGRERTGARVGTRVRRRLIAELPDRLLELHAFFHRRGARRRARLDGPCRRSPPAQRSSNGPRAVQ